MYSHDLLYYRAIFKFESSINKLQSQENIYIKIKDGFINNKSSKEIHWKFYKFIKLAKRANRR